MAAVFTLVSLAACEKKDNSVQPGSADKPTPYVAAASGAGASSTSTALPGVLPVPHELPGNKGAGPGQGATAVGGLTGQQEAGGQNSRPSQPTGGDTSASSGAASGAGK